MTQLLNIGVIGLGVMGQRMLARLDGHARLKPCVVWDADPAAVAAVLARWPQLVAADGAEAVIATPGLHSLYIATPPEPHLAYSARAFDAGLAVLCEKPLTIDLPGAEQLIKRIKTEGQRASVNFTLAAAPGLALLQTHFGAASHLPLGAPTAIEIEVAFDTWPRRWQAGAGGWLSERFEGGFTREVLSHFIFVLQRVLGPAQVVAHRVSYPEDGRSAEVMLRAELRAGGVPVHVSGRVASDIEGDVGEHNRMLWRGAKGEIELRQWLGEVHMRHYEQGADQRIDVVLDTSLNDQISQWVSMIDRQSHSLPGYAEALAVQRTIENLLTDTP